MKPLESINPSDQAAILHLGGVEGGSCVAFRLGGNFLKFSFSFLKWLTLSHYSIRIACVVMWMNECVLSLLFPSLLV